MNPVKSEKKKKVNRTISKYISCYYFKWFKLYNQIGLRYDMNKTSQYYDNIKLLL